MTPEILKFLNQMSTYIGPDRTVFEVGSYNVNGSARTAVSHKKWIGVDMEKGPDVDFVVDEAEIYASFLKTHQYYPDLFVCCECLEHTRDPIATVNEIKKAMKFAQKNNPENKNGCYLILTSPGYHFQYHAYPRDYWRFSTDTFHDVFFDGLEILHVGYLDSNEGKNTTVSGVAKLPS